MEKPTTYTAKNAEHVFVFIAVVQDIFVHVMTKMAIILDHTNRIQVTVKLVLLIGILLAITLQNVVKDYNLYQQQN